MNAVIDFLASCQYYSDFQLNENVDTTPKKRAGLYAFAASILSALISSLI